MMTIAIILLCAFINRIRGGGFDGKKLPAKPLYWCAPMIAVIGGIVDGTGGLLWGVAYFVWGLFPWGYLQLLGRPVEGKKPEPVEATLLAWSRGNVYLAFGLRHLLAGPLAPFIVAAYEVAWRLFPKSPIIVGELLTGAMWGLLIAI